MAREYTRTHLDKDLPDVIEEMILNHHKLREYRHGRNSKQIEIFRKADWIDVTKGYMLFNVTKEEYQKILDEHPYGKFRSILIAKTIENVMKNPTNPFPMFKL